MFVGEGVPVEECKESMPDTLVLFDFIPYVFLALKWWVWRLLAVVSGVGYHW